MDADQRHAIYVKSGMGKATVFGVNDGDVVTVVTVDGKVVAVEEAVGSEVTFALAKELISSRWPVQTDGLQW